MSTSWEGDLSLSMHFEMLLQKGSVFCISQRVSLCSFVRGGGVFTLSMFDVDLTSAGVVSCCRCRWQDHLECLVVGS